MTDRLAEIERELPDLDPQSLKVEWVMSGTLYWLIEEIKRLRSEQQGWADTFAQNMAVMGDENERLRSTLYPAHLIRMDGRTVHLECPECQWQWSIHWGELDHAFEDTGADIRAHHAAHNPEPHDTQVDAEPGR